MSFLTLASKFPKWCFSFPLFISSTPLCKERRLWAEYSGLLHYKYHPHPPHKHTHRTRGGGTNKAVPSPINLTFSSVPEPASKLSYLGERGEPRENARASAKPRRAEERSFPHPPLSRLLSRASRASTFHDISQMESLLGGSQAICSSSQSPEI